MNPDTFKLVVFDLPQLITNDIKEELKEKFGINLKFIKEIKTERSNADDTLYMMEFFKNEVSKSQLVQIRYLCDVRVFWRNPLRRKGPTQCSICFMYGHDGDNCH